MARLLEMLHFWMYLRVTIFELKRIVVPLHQCHPLDFHLGSQPNSLKQQENVSRFYRRSNLS